MLVGKHVFDLKTRSVLDLDKSKLKHSESFNKPLQNSQLNSTTILHNSLKSLQDSNFNPIDAISNIIIKDDNAINSINKKITRQLNSSKNLKHYSNLVDISEKNAQESVINVDTLHKSYIPFNSTTKLVANRAKKTTDKKWLSKTADCRPVYTYFGSNLVQIFFRNLIQSLFLFLLSSIIMYSRQTYQFPRYC